MFRRRASSSGKIHYRINIDKSMCPNPVDIYIDGDTYQHSFNGSYLDIYHKKIEVIRIDGQIILRNPQYEYDIMLGVSGGIASGTLTYPYNSGIHCDLAEFEIAGNRITEFTPITEITDPEEIINFTYMTKTINQITTRYHIIWQGNLVVNDYCIATNSTQGYQSIAVGNGAYSNYRVSIVIV